MIQSEKNTSRTSSRHFWSGSPTSLRDTKTCFGQFGFQRPPRKCEIDPSGPRMARPCRKHNGILASIRAAVASRMQAGLRQQAVQEDPPVQEVQRRFSMRSSDAIRLWLDLTGRQTPGMAQSSRLAADLQSAARLPAEVAARPPRDLGTGGKAVVNGSATAVKNVATLGLSTSQLELIGVTKEDRARGYDTAVTIATASGEVLIAVGTGGPRIGSEQGRLGRTNRQRRTRSLRRGGQRGRRGPRDVRRFKMA